MATTYGALKNSWKAARPPPRPICKRCLHNGEAIWRAAAVRSAARCCNRTTGMLFVWIRPCWEGSVAHDGRERERGAEGESADTERER